jgi:chemotaxis family two-component system response regulator Rcp1
VSRRTENGTIEVLLVEDNPGDARLAREAFKNGGEQSPNSLHFVTDGVEAMRFLRREDGYSDAPRPNIILLDLNLPRKDGREVLEEIKSDPELKLIPVIVMTTSRAEQDIVESYELQANAYLTKPISFGEFMDVAESFKSFWFCSVELPPVEGH